MKYSRLLFVTTALAFVLFSCQKEVDFPPGQNPGTGNPGTGNPGTGNPGTGNPGSSNDIIGDYDFINLSAHTDVTITTNVGTDQMKTVTISDYVTKNNVGTVKITSTQMISDNVGYEIDTTMNGKTYINGVLISDIDLPFVMSVPPASNVSTYVKNSADSITTTGTFGIAQGTSGGGTSSAPFGLKLSWSGDTLSMKISTVLVENINQMGVSAIAVSKITGITRMKKK